ncbi:MAG: phosphoglycerate kinase / triosephosphate isomerase [Candidatus Berkelbacteria bacterium Athens1014_28]|uniref:Phosphoglycerate kinase n=1 Tax=Candidatus Berkelbacteria bacterium Athens1014_28 TaxID=2017145 RepID=A0A554LPY7_9BACT|nr:MAG: phosphoglycerate kinase / triosephosphate isomerase [Candidatus Berkelbacteria bacterium Athens1014_28]
MKSIAEVDVENKAVFLRVDWNLPLKDGKIVDDNRIKSTLPTINYLRKKNCRIIIGTHLGRPEGKIVHELSTKILAKKLLELLPETNILQTDFVVEPEVKKFVENLETKEILILGNLRWHREEEENNPKFAKILASYADIFVNDAFAVSHRAHASVEAITKYLPSYAGVLLEKEVVSLSVLTENPRHPFILILGGAKIKDKIGLIEKFAPVCDKILVGGCLAITLQYSRGKKVSKSKFESNVSDIAKRIFKVAGKKLILPVDQKIKKIGKKDFSIMDIGDKTLLLFKKEIRNAKTIFWNGNVGYSESKKFESGTLGIARAVRRNKFVKIVAGGDTVGFLKSHKIVDNFTFISTGGGAALEFLAGEKLPGLVALGYYK